MLSPSLQNKQTKSVDRGLTVLLSALIVRLDGMNLRVCAPLLDRAVPQQTRLLITHESY